MEPVNLLLVGCGMMGARHVLGLTEIERVAPGSAKLLAVCDVREAAAEKLADEAEKFLGFRPKVFTDLETALSSEPSLQAADVVTDPRSHDELVVSLLEGGLNVISEKPLALTVARGQRMVKAAEKTGRILATAENNRRDPMNRLAKACLDEGIIGAPDFALQISINTGDRIIATTWRHRLAMGGVIFDVAIHTGYILEYLLGPIKSIYAQTQLVQSERDGREFDGNQAHVEVDAEDCFSALLEFESGVQGHWTAHFSSAGEGMFKRLVLGSDGTLNLPSDRSGRPIEVQRGAHSFESNDLLAELPDYHLNEIETSLFDERPASYSLESTITDRRLIAAEIHDFLEAIRHSRPPEVDGATGLRSVAIIYAIMESALSKRPVTLAEVLDGSLHAYQDMVEEAQLA